MTMVRSDNALCTSTVGVEENQRKKNQQRNIRYEENCQMCEERFGVWRQITRNFYAERKTAQRRTNEHVRSDGALRSKKCNVGTLLSLLFSHNFVIII